MVDYLEIIFDVSEQISSSFIHTKLKIKTFFTLILKNQNRHHLDVAASAFISNHFPHKQKNKPYFPFLFYLEDKKTNNKDVNVV